MDLRTVQKAVYENKLNKGFNITNIDQEYTETTICETDDLIAGYALSIEEETEMIISSFDSDFFQLITDKVSVLRYRGDKTLICTHEYIKEKFAILPEQCCEN